MINIERTISEKKIDDMATSSKNRPAPMNTIVALLVPANSEANCASKLLSLKNK